jgi:hypothetical protein
MKEETPFERSVTIPNERLKKLWKHAVTTSLSPDNIFPAYQIYYFLIRKEIIEKYLKTNTSNEEPVDVEENVYD